MWKRLAEKEDEGLTWTLLKNNLELCWTNAKASIIAVNAAELTGGKDGMAVLVDVLERVWRLEKSELNLEEHVVFAEWLWSIARAADRKVNE